MIQQWSLSSFYPQSVNRWSSVLKFLGPLLGHKTWTFRPPSKRVELSFYPLTSKPVTYPLKWVLLLTVSAHINYLWLIHLFIISYFRREQRQRENLRRESIHIISHYVFTRWNENKETFRSSFLFRWVERMSLCGLNGQRRKIFLFQWVLPLL